MNNQNHELTSKFDQMASSYDKRNEPWAPSRAALYSLMRAVFEELPSHSRLLAVGAGTGIEILFLAQAFPDWQFTVVEPAPAMLEVCRQRLEEHGVADRCTFYEGYLENLPASEPFDGATCLLVSHFMTEKESRSQFFHQIQSRLQGGGILVSSDLCADLSSPTYPHLLKVWFQHLKSPETSDADIENMRRAYVTGVAVLPAEEVEAIIAAGGFELPTLFFQSLMIRAWYSRKASE